MRRYYYQRRPLPRKLAYAIWDGDVETVETLLRKGYNANAKTPYGGYNSKQVSREDAWNRRDTMQLAPWEIPRYDWIPGSMPAICLAVDDSFPRREFLATMLPLLAVLAAHGADINTQDTWEISLLHKVACRGFASACKLLLDCGADPNPPFEEITPLNTALMGACCYQEADAEERLLAGTVDPPVDYEATVAHLLASGAKPGIHETALMGDIEALRISLHEINDIEHPIGHGLTPLMYAVIGGHRETIAALLQSGANKEVEDRQHWTPLVHAAARNQIPVIQQLLDAGANAEHSMPEKRLPGHVDRYDFSALTTATFHGHVEAVALLRPLIRQNAPSLEDQIAIAARFGRERLFHWLLTHEAEQHNLSQEFLNQLLNETMPNTMPPEEFPGSVRRTLPASLPWIHPKRNSKGIAAIARWLLEQGADANTSEHYCPILIHVVRADSSARCLNAELIELLLHHGADVNGRDLTEIPPNASGVLISTYGWTALMHAWCLETAQILLKWGADVNVRDEAGNTALSLAKERKQTEIVELLDAPTNNLEPTRLG